MTDTLTHIAFCLFSGCSSAPPLHVSNPDIHSTRRLPDQEPKFTSQALGRIPRAKVKTDAYISEMTNEIELIGNDEGLDSKVTYAVRTCRGPENAQGSTLIKIFETLNVARQRKLPVDVTYVVINGVFCIESAILVND